MQEFPQKWKMNPLYYVMLMYHMQWQLRDEDDEEYEPRVESGHASYLAAWSNEKQKT